MPITMKTIKNITLITLTLLTPILYAETLGKNKCIKKEFRLARSDKASSCGRVILKDRVDTQSMELLNKAEEFIVSFISAGKENDREQIKEMLIGEIEEMSELMKLTLPQVVLTQNPEVEALFPVSHNGNTVLICATNFFYKHPEYGDGSVLYPIQIIARNDKFYLYYDKSFDVGDIDYIQSYRLVRNLSPNIKIEDLFE